LRLHGAHQVANALAAAAVGLQVGLDVQEVARLLSGLEAASRWRMEVSERADGLVVVNDAYNANPDSVRAALAATAAMARSRGARAWAVLGPMLEQLEPHQAHAEIGREAARQGLAGVVAVGADAAAAAEAAGAAGLAAVAVPDRVAALAAVRERLHPGDVVLVKASRSIGLEYVAAALLAADCAEVGPGGGRDGGTVSPGAGTSR
jgi:UDP-N-acetylmuramoyl-tripeptide--D-alanyl-D-alanine ligase